MTTTEERHEIDSRIRDIDERIDRLESTAQDLLNEADDLRRTLDAITKKYPPLPEVMVVPMPDGVTWYTDGYRAVRGAWPGEYRERSHGVTPESMASMIGSWEKIDAPAGPLEVVDDQDYGRVVRLSGGRLRADWFEETSAHFGSTPGVVVHWSEAGRTAIWKDDAGNVLAVQMGLIS